MIGINGTIEYSELFLIMTYRLGADTGMDLSEEKPTAVKMVREIGSTL